MSTLQHSTFSFTTNHSFLMKRVEVPTSRILHCWTATCLRVRYMRVTVDLTANLACINHDFAVIVIFLNTDCLKTYAQ